MPSGSDNVTHDPQSQIKHCSSCHSPLSADSQNSPSFVQDSQDSNDTTIVCASCRLLGLRVDTPVPARAGFIFADVERTLLHRAASLQDGDNEVNHGTVLPDNRSAHLSDQPCMSGDANPQTSQPLSSTPASHGSFSVHRYVSTPTPASLPRMPPPIQTPSVVPPTQRDLSYPSSMQPRSSRSSYPPPLGSPNTRHRPSDPPTFSPDPLADITRFRVRSQGHHCLYPGSSFQGTQRSGRNSYDVKVTIVDVDFTSSHLCGYLRIRGLTDDWPELTTYFDAEIIGSKYGFLTRNWGATEQEDMLHWARFPAFRHLRHELKRPQLTMKDADRGAVFMRWKEKFLVPDHRVQDINGASFAGFYYVCVDFNPQQSTQASQQPPLPASPEDDMLTSPIIPGTAKSEHSPRARRESVTRGARRVGRSSSRGAPHANVAKMSGFYFHQNSEPYQELDLNHVPDRGNACFEFR